MKGKKDVKAEEGECVIMSCVYARVLKVRASCLGLFNKHSTLWHA